MRKAALLYNTLSGRRRERRLADVEIALSVLRNAGIEVSSTATRSATDATEQTRRAVVEGCEAVFACGGDGTVHDVLQGLVGSSLALGIIPLGTGNALAHDLRIPLSPAAAARSALMAKPRRIAVGLVKYQDFSGKQGSKYFTVALGIGVDAHLFYKLNPLMKLRLGMGAYYAQATRLWLTHQMDYFRVELPGNDRRQTNQTEVSQLLAVRIRDFGGPRYDREIVARALESDDTSGLPRGALFYRRFADQMRADRRALAACWRRPIRELDAADLAVVTLPALFTVGDRDSVAGDPEPIAAAMRNAKVVRLAGKDHMNAVGAKQHREAVLSFLAELGD
jgi:diacylglycerol kinase family enzyme